MKEETFKEYEWRGKGVNELVKKLGLEGNVVSIFASNDHGRYYLHIKTITESKGK